MLDVLCAATPVAGERVHGRVELRPGGSSANAAAWAAAAGADAAVVGRVGNDSSAALVERALRRRGVTPQLARDPEAGTGVVLLVGDGGRGGIVADRGASARLAPEDVPDPLEADAVLVSGYALLHPDTWAAAEAALTRASAGYVAVDAASASLVARRGVEHFLGASAGANAVLANEDEARVLTGEGREAAAVALGRRFRLACVKLGPEGAVAVLDGRVAHSSAIPVAVEDPLGAGDAFGAVLLTRLAAGAALEEALAAACEAGAKAAASRNGWPPGG
jgi:sugar/nucleoside kinase (ribokinase family)